MSTNGAKILIVDDISTNRILLKQALKLLGFEQVIEAENGIEAIAVFEKEKPHLVIMDIMMPDMDGCQAASIIKEKAGNEYIPIIFLTALSSDDALSTALASGGDDFLSKPFNVPVLESKINAHFRIRELNNQVSEQNAQLMVANRRLRDEHDLIEHFFENAIHRSDLDNELVRYHMSSLSVFNGDILLASRAPHGGYYLIMGDFTGHGLTAAMGTLPVAMIFFKMVAEGHAVGDIAREINLQLNKLLPPSMFFVASVLELGSSGDSLSIWMGGMPEHYWLSKDGQLKGRIKSQHMPLGVCNDNEFDTGVRLLNIEQGDQFYLYSDGVVEARNTDAELFGHERLLQTLLEETDNRFDKVLKKLTSFTGDNSQNDDITLVELTCHALPKQVLSKIKAEADFPFELEMNVTLHAKDMKNDRVIPRLMDVLSSLPLVRHHKEILSVVLTEVYSNILDHSILGFESRTKNSESHFNDYYEKRNQALQQLQDAEVTFKFKLVRENDSPCLDIEVTDSGSGYKTGETTSGDEKLHGRGMGIIQHFCEKVDFENEGRTLRLRYNLAG